MANGDDGKKFDLELGTKADTSGLEATERALKGVENAAKAAVNPMTDGSQLAAMERQKEAAEQATEATVSWAEAGAANNIVIRDLTEAEEDALKVMRETDVQRAQALKAGREQAKVLEEIAASSRRLVAIQLAGQLNQIAQEFRGMSKETDAVLDGVNAMTAGLMTGNPYVALGTAALSAGRMIQGAYKEAAAADAYFAKAVVDGQKMIEEALDAKRIRGRKTFLEEHFEKGNAEIEKAIDNLARLERMMTAQRSADSSDREADQRAALRSGADPAAVNQADIRGDQTDQLAALAAGVKAATDKANQLEIRAGELAAQVATKQAEDGFDQAEIDNAKQLAAAAKDAAEAAAADAQVVVFEAIQKSAEIYNASMDRVAQASSDNDAAAVAKAQAIVDQATKGDQVLSAAQQAALDRTKEALVDGKLSAQEQQMLSGDLRQVITSFKGTLEEQRALMVLFLELTTGQQANTAALKDVAADLRRDVSNLQKDMETLRQQGR